MSKSEFLDSCADGRVSADDNGVIYLDRGDGTMFVLDADGLATQNTEKANAAPERYCGYIKPISRFSTEETCGFDVEIKDRDGRRKTVSIDYGDIVDGGTTVQRQLARAGLVFYRTQGRNTKPPINDFLNLFSIEKRHSMKSVEVVTKGGWSADYGAFLFDNVVLGSGEGVRLDTTAKSARLTVTGTVQDWGATMGAYAAKSSIMRFAAYAALAAPLVQIVGRQTTIFHLFGESSKGKSTALYVAASVYGTKADYVATWRATKNNQCTKAIKHNNLILCLDELKQGAKVLDTVAYDICNEVDKGRDNVNCTEREQKRWSLIVLSTGEATLDGIRSRASGGIGDTATGEHVRFVEIPATVGAGGVFDVIDAETETDGSRRRIVDAVKQCPNCGAVGRAFIENVLRVIAEKGADGFRKEATAWMDGFIAGFGSVGTHEARVLSAFAVVAYAGRLAHEWGLVPWGEGDAEAVTSRTFRAWQCSGESIEARNDEIISNVRADPSKHHNFYNKIGYSRKNWGAPITESFEQGVAHPSKGVYGAVLRRLTDDNDDGSQVDCAIILTNSQFKDLAARVGGAYSEELSELLSRRGMLVGNDRGGRGARFRVQNARAQRIGLRDGARYIVIRIDDACDVASLLKKRCGA